MAQSFGQFLDLISNPTNLDATVFEVFHLMLGVECELADDGATVSSAIDCESVTAVVGFGGVLSGVCVFRCDSASAMMTAGRMTGVEFDTIDDTVKDGMGEICNMLAGAWKGRVRDLSERCSLSVPAVITGCDYRIHVQKPAFQLHRSYRFEGACFLVSIVCDSVR